MSKILNFPTFHSHPASIVDSASTPERFAERELELGTGTITATDHGSLAACVDIYDLAKKRGLVPICGLEAYFRDDDCSTLESLGISKNKDGGYNDYLKYMHVTMHFLDQAAYEVGVKLLSKADARAEVHGQQRKPIFDWRDLEELGAANVTFGSGCLIGMTARHLVDQDNPEAALHYYERLRSIVKPGNFYVEVFPHKCDRKYVNGVFLTFVNDVVQKFYGGKVLRTNVGEVTASQLAHEFNLKDHRGHETLLAVKNYGKWKDQEPQKLVKVEAISGFLENECREGWGGGSRDVQKGANEFLLALAARYGDPVLVSDDSHYAYPDEAEVQTIRLLASGDNFRFEPGYHRQTSEEAFATFQQTMGTTLKQFEQWVDNSVGWASRFKDFKLSYAPSLPTKFYPPETMFHLLDLINKHGRMDWGNSHMVGRLRSEILLLHDNGTIDLLPYFFLAEDVCSAYSAAGMITGPGRGSAAGLLLTYLLGITHVDALKYDLSMNRFLTLDRVRSGKLPDVDLDFPSRDLLVDPEKGWLRKRFGDHYAQISIDNTLRIRSTIKDVARVKLGSVPKELEKLTATMAKPPEGIEDIDFVLGYETPGGWQKGSVEWDPSLVEFARKYPGQWELAKKTMGLTRSKGRHASAFVVANRPIQDFIPLMTVSDVTCTQYTASAVEKVGGIKMDFLVINSLNDIGDCVRMVQSRHEAEGQMQVSLRIPLERAVPFRGSFHDVWNLPADQAVFADVCAGDTETVFQFNTQGARKWLQHFDHDKPGGNKVIDSVAAMATFTALDRPGPLDIFVDSPERDGRHNMLVEYARRARGLPAAKTPAILNELLPETYGVLVYQEQVEHIYKHLMECSGAEAEEFRSDVAKKRKEKILQVYPTFVERVGARIGEEAAKELWSYIETWSEYGFNKAHAVSYATIAYACAFLKHHYPLEWWCAVLKNAKKDEVFEKFWRHCGHFVTLPDVNKSELDFAIEGDRVRAPIGLLHGVGPVAHAQIVQGRPYESLEDFCRKLAGGPNRNAVTRKVAYSLIIGGTMDSLFDSQTTTFEKLEAYERALALATGKKIKEGELVDEKYVHLNALNVYQLKKKLLPGWFEQVSSKVLDCGLDRLVQKGKNYAYKVTGRGWSREYVLVTGKILDVYFQHHDADMRLDLSVLCYVLSTRKFAYKGGSRQACEVVFDVDGYAFKAVKWVSEGDELGPEYANLDGSMAVLCLRLGGGKRVTLDAIEVVEKPLQ